MAIGLEGGPAWAHDDGPPEYPCDEEGPFGLPGLTDPPDQIGQWGPVVQWPVRPVHGAVLATEKVLLWGTGSGGVLSGMGTQLWDIQTNTFDPKPLDSEIFCSGHATLADGRLLVAGGGSNPTPISDTSIFDPVAEAWIPAPSMEYLRYYPTVTTLPDGRALVMSGQDHFQPDTTSDIPEIYDPSSNSWKSLPAAEISRNTYPNLFVLADGKAFDTGPADEFGLQPTRVLDVEAQSWTLLDRANYAASFGSAATYGPGKILKIGDRGGISMGNTEVIDTNDISPAWRKVDALEIPRRRPGLVLLPDGQSLVIGGQVDGNGYSEECAVHSSEMWNPVTELWTTMASQARPRMYHAVALLLPDGRVLSAGGENSHVSGAEQNAEIYSPPYLFKGARPSITTTPSKIAYDQVFHVATPDGASIDSVAFMRPGAFTHNFDHNQRYMSLAFSVVPGGLDVTAPMDSNHAPPGDHMLFIVNQSGVPSVAAFIRIAQPCDDGADNDGDTLVDFPADTGCSSTADVSEGPDCGDGVDNDTDGLVDYPADTGCADALDNSEKSATHVCDDGLDNDGDGIFDFPHDVGCDSVVDADETSLAFVCDDGIDNDGDGTIDFIGDPGCTGFADPDETDVLLTCDDGIDNDGDTLVDYPADSGCTGLEGLAEDADEDGDTILDSLDNCPLIANPGQENQDGDSEGNECDDDDDNDGLVDTVETGTGTYVSGSDTGSDSLLPDTDGDGLADGDEVLVYETDPNAVDTDGDSWNDDLEISAGSNPNDPLHTPRVLPALSPWGSLLGVALLVVSAFWCFSHPSLRA